MAFTVSDVYTQARTYLNDAGGSLFSDAVLLPFIKAAFEELQTINNLLGAASIIDMAQLTIGVGVARLAYTGTTPVLPAALREPIFMEERASGSSLAFTPMVPRRWEPDQPVAGDSLQYWAWRENEIKFVPPGANNIRQVQLWFVQALTAPASGATPIEISNAQNFLAAKTAALCAALSNENYDRGMVLDDLAKNAMEILVGTETKRQQATPVRRRSYRRGRRGYDRSLRKFT